MSEIDETTAERDIRIYTLGFVWGVAKGIEFADDDPEDMLNISDSEWFIGGKTRLESGDF